MGRTTASGTVMPTWCRKTQCQLVPRGRGWTRDTAAAVVPVATSDAVKSEFHLAKWPKPVMASPFPQRCGVSTMYSEGVLCLMAGRRPKGDTEDTGKLSKNDPPK